MVVKVGQAHGTLVACYNIKKERADSEKVRTSDTHRIGHSMKESSSVLGCWLLPGKIDSIIEELVIFLSCKGDLSSRRVWNNDSFQLLHLSL